MDRNQIAFRIAMVGGIATAAALVVVRGRTGGFIIGAIAFLIFYGLAWLVLSFVSVNIFEACRTNNMERLKQLIGEGVDVNALDHSKLAPIAYAAAFGHIEILKILIDAGAKLNEFHKDGATALMNAAFYGREEIVDFLLAKGADLNLKTADGRTAADYAKTGKQTRLEEKLRKLEQRK